MLGLSGYDSSDGETESSQPASVTKSKDVLTNQSSQQPRQNGVTTVSPIDTKARPSTSELHFEAGSVNATAAGPQLGPSMPAGESLEDGLDFGVAPSSPYTSSCQAVRNLTLPPIPNFEIPPSPPGSPPPGSTEKFTRFLELKKKGVHFNEKLETSSALRNPNLLQKLRDFASIDDDEQYASSLPGELAVPTNFPAWAYADELNKMQAETTKRREKERDQLGRDSVTFVSASATASGSSTRSGTPGTGARVAPRSAAERVMAGLNGEKGGASVASTKRTDSGQRKSRFDPR